MKSAVWAVLLGLSSVAAFAAPQPPGEPGIPHRWAPALKQAVGTAYERSGARSPTWFTVAEGILSEVFFPSVDHAQVGDLQFIVTDGRQLFVDFKKDVATTVAYLDEGLTTRISGIERAGRFRFEQDIVTDASSPVVRIQLRVRWNQPGLRLFVLFKPTVGGRGAVNLAYAAPAALAATRSPVQGAGAYPVVATLVAGAPFRAQAAGFVGFSDGWQDLSRNFALRQLAPEAGPGNVALVAEIALSGAPESTVDLALGFGRTYAESLALSQGSLRQVPFARARAAYEAGWKGYLAELTSSSLGANVRFLRESALARRSAQLIKIHEDKRVRGAIVASLSKPALPGDPRATDDTGGYHLIWPRDLYHAAMGLLAAGDVNTPRAVLGFLARTQKPDGSWWQNFTTDGRAHWTKLQMDQVAFPILLANQVRARLGQALPAEVTQMVRRAAAFLAAHGPITEQDRWEEIGGYVPSSIGAEIAGLRAAAVLLGQASYAERADAWSAMLDRWTLVPSGPWGANYYLRTSLAGDASRNEPYDIANGGGPARTQEILDGGFLELVRLGVREPREPSILSTLELYENPRIGIASGTRFTPGAQGYRRYNRDGYGPSGVGGFWPLLAGERGMLAIAQGDRPRALAQLRMLERSALPSGHLPEQTISLPGPGQGLGTATIGAGVATPLVWAHAEDLLLHRSLEEGRVFDHPNVAGSRR